MITFTAAALGETGDLLFIRTLTLFFHTPLPPLPPPHSKQRASGLEPSDPSACFTGGLSVEPTVKIILPSTQLGRTASSRPTSFGSGVLAASAVLASVAAVPTGAPNFQRNAVFSSTFKGKL